jgi:hypothetical protein
MIVFGTIRFSYVRNAGISLTRLTSLTEPGFLRVSRCALPDLSLTKLALRLTDADRACDPRPQRRGRVGQPQVRPPQYIVGTDHIAARLSEHDLMFSKVPRRQGLRPADASLTRASWKKGMLDP